MKQKNILLTIILLGLFLRLFKLGYHDLWYDEAISISLSNKYSIIWNPPLFYTILHYWMKLFGQSEFSIRFPSVIFSTLSIPSIYLLAKRLFNPKVGALAAIIMAISPMQIWYAQEARPYSAVLLFGIISTYFLIMAIKGAPRYWYYFVVTSILGLYTGEFYTVLLISHIILFFVHVLFYSDKKGIKNLMLSLLFISLCFLPWLNYYLHKFHSIKQGFWIPEPDVSSLVITFENFLVGYNLSQNYYFIADFLIIVLFLAAFKSIYKNRDARNNFYICLFLVIFPMLSTYIFSKLIVSIYLDRGLLIFSPCYYILLAVGIGHLSRKKTGFSVCIILCFLFIVAIKSFYQDYMPTPPKHHMGAFIKRPIKPLVKFIEQNSNPEDIVAFTNLSSRSPFRFYTNDKSRELYQFFDPELPSTNTNLPITETDWRIPKQKVPLLKAKRIWVIASNWTHDGGLDEQSESVKAYLDKKMTLTLAKNIDGVWVYLYQH